MARERYLVGVDPNELKQKESVPPPQSPHGKWVNFWYHYKWLVLGIAVAAAIVVALTVHTVTRVKPDYLICMVATKEISTAADVRLEEILTPYGVDRNGDGKVRVEVHCLNVSQTNGDEVNPSAIPDQQAAMGHIVSRDVDLWAVDPAFYTGTLRSAFDGDESRFFMPLDSIDAAGISADKKYWNWEDSSLLSADEELKSMPKTLYWGVRVLPEDASEDLKTQVTDMLALLKAFAEDYS